MYRAPTHDMYCKDIHVGIHRLHIYHVSQTGVEVCNVVPNAVTEQWMTLFGKEEDEPQEEFTGFTRNEV